MQYERILNNALAKGHKTVSEFMRINSLGFDTVMEKKIRMIYDAVVDKEDTENPAENRSLQEYMTP
ncbi:MAG: hypothetical protein V1735_04530 [Nanoarchaeota archaeon]